MGETGLHDTCELEIPDEVQLELDLLRTYFFSDESNNYHSKADVRNSLKELYRHYEEKAKTEAV